jgi:hypothetical protein
MGWRSCHLDAYNIKHVLEKKSNLSFFFLTILSRLNNLPLNTIHICCTWCSIIYSMSIVFILRWSVLYSNRTANLHRLFSNKTTSATTHLLYCIEKIQLRDSNAHRNIYIRISAKWKANTELTAYLQKKTKTWHVIILLRIVVVTSFFFRLQSLTEEEEKREKRQRLVRSFLLKETQVLFSMNVEITITSCFSCRRYVTYWEK